MDVTDLAWAAGFIDGEGCITIRARGPRGTRRSHNYTARMCAFNLDPAPLMKLRQLFGGSVRYRKRVRRLRPCGEWRIDGKAVVDALSQLLPFLTVKRAQAEIAIRIHLIKYNPGRAGLPASAVGEYEQLRQQITALKHCPYDLAQFPGANRVQ